MASSSGQQLTTRGERELAPVPVLTATALGLRWSPDYAESNNIFREKLELPDQATVDKRIEDAVFMANAAHRPHWGEVADFAQTLGYHEDSTARRDDPLGSQEKHDRAFHTRSMIHTLQQAVAQERAAWENPQETTAQISELSLPDLPENVAVWGVRVYGDVETGYRFRPTEHGWVYAVILGRKAKDGNGDYADRRIEDGLMLRFLSPAFRRGDANHEGIMQAEVSTFTTQPRSPIEQLEYEASRFLPNRIIESLHREAGFQGLGFNDDDVVTAHNEGIGTFLRTRFQLDSEELEEINEGLLERPLRTWSNEGPTSEEIVDQTLQQADGILPTGTITDGIIFALAAEGDRIYHYKNPFSNDYQPQFRNWEVPVSGIVNCVPDQVETIARRLYGRPDGPFVAQLSGWGLSWEQERILAGQEDAGL